MDYSNTKKGLKKLLISEIMLIIVNIETIFNNIYVALIAILIALIGYIIGLKGLKLIAKDNVGYKKARSWAIASLISVPIGITLMIISDLLISNSLSILLGKALTAVNAICEFMATYLILQTSSFILQEYEDESLIKYTKDTTTVYLFSFLIGNIISTSVSFMSNNQLLISFILGLLGSGLSLFARFRYFVFLKKMHDLI